jgi:plastocyanin
MNVNLVRTAFLIGPLLAVSACSGDDSTSDTTSGGHVGTTTTTGSTGSTGSGGSGGAGTGGTAATGGGGGNGGSATGTGGAGGHGGSGTGGGGAAPCVDSNLCPGVDEDCKVRACINGACDFSFLPEGTPAGPETPGECHKNVCDGLGAIISVPDDTNLPDDGNPCTEDKCSGGQKLHSFTPKGTACPGTPMHCDGAGACVLCDSDSQCNGGTCTGGQCVGSFPCGDNIKNGLETGVDCGGGVCAQCFPLSPCKIASDCNSNICTNGICDFPAATCSDNFKNQDESDTDCGGKACPKCPNTRTCGSNADCESGICLGQGTAMHPKRCLADMQINDCTIGTAENHVNDQEVVVSFGDALGNHYAPRCIVVTLGAKVRFEGNFGMHPLVPGVVSNGNAFPAANSMIQPTNSGTSATFVAGSPDRYGYYCGTHYASGMTGAVFVIP